MINDKRVTVVIPAYNAEHWILDSIRSVREQTYKNVQIVVVDDKSTDKTVMLVRDVDDVQLVRLPENSGECVASRVGFLHASGDYICRLSADDAFLTKHHLAEQVNVMNRSGADWCYNVTNEHGPTPSEAKVVHSCLLPIPYRFYRRGLSRFDNLILKFPYLAFVCIMIRNPVNSSTLMIRAESYRTVLWSLEERIDCDFLLLANLLLKRLHGLAINTSGVFYRTHAESASNDENYKSICHRHRAEMRTKVLNGNYPYWLKTVMKLMEGR